MTVRYVSTRGLSPAIGFEDVVLAGLAPDGGLYVPETLPQFSPAEIASFAALDYVSLAGRILAPFTEGLLSGPELRALLEKSYSGFRHAAVAPLVQLSHNQFVLELFHGPTLAFKDFALQFLGNLLDHILSKRNENAVVLGATSGDTGSAAIAGCRGRARLRIFILHPHERVSEVQRRQMTTVSDANVHNLAVKGTFDDCQDIVKTLFSDQAFREAQHLVAVNSINWARIVAQVVYYFYAAVALGAPARAVRFVVPTGNFGDIYAGHIARRMGLPVETLVIATNTNDILARALKDGNYSAKGVAATLSPSMDIQAPSNFERLLFELHDNDGKRVAALMQEFRKNGSLTFAPPLLKRLQAEFTAHRVDDATTAATIADIYSHTGWLADPHTAVGLAAAKALPAPPHVPVITLATAHPAKFPEAVQEAAGLHPALPPHMATLFEREERYEVMDNDAQYVKSFIAGAGMTYQLTTLKNGLRVASEFLPGVESVAVAVSVGVGSRYENERQCGLSHLLEHMAFKGTKQRSARDIAEAFDAIGGQFNAYTSAEHTVYHAKVLKGSLPLAVDILSDILLNSVFDAEELKREQGVVLQEIAAHHDTPDDLIFDLFDAVAFPDQPLGRSILGTPEQVAGYQRDDVLVYMTQHYTPERMVLSAAGNVSHDVFVSLAERYFSGLSGKGGKLAPPAGTYGGGDTRKTDDLEQLHLVFGFPGISVHDDDYNAMQLYSGILGGGMSSRLFQEIREKRGMAYHVSSAAQMYGDCGALVIYSATGKEESAQLPLLLADELKNMRNVTDAEMRRVKNQQKAELLMARESPGTVAGWIGKHLLMFSRYREAPEILERIENVSSADIARMTERVLCGPLTLAALGPVENLPKAEAIAARLKAA